MARVAVTLLELALHFGALSLVAFGGIPTVVPEMQRFVVEIKGWTSAPEFLQLFAIAQAAPGPNLLIGSLIGWKVAGLAGALIALAALCGPPAVLAWWISALWDRLIMHSPWRLILQRAMTPLVVGLLFAAGYVIATPGAPDWRLWSIAAASAIAIVALPQNPLYIIGGAALVGAFLLS